jgi:hypothetical protein
MGQRYQKEIEEILEQVNEAPPSNKRAAGRGGGSGGRPAQPDRPQNSGTPLFSWLPFRLTAGRLLLTGVVLLLGALVLRSAIPGVAGPLIWIGIGLFIASYIVFFIRPRRIMEQRWRGRSIEDEPLEDGNPLERFWHWVNRG